MTDTAEQHPICQMCESSKHLREKAMFTKRRAEIHAEHARKASTDLANLDIEGIFAKLHRMVEIVGGKSKHSRPAQPQTRLSMAAE